MGRPGLARLAPIAVGAALLLLLAILAVHQYLWIGQVSILESQRLRAALFGAGAAFAEDFDHEVTHVFVELRTAAAPADAAAVAGASGPDAQLAARVVRQVDAWRLETAFPGLIRDIFYVDADRGAASAGGGDSAPDPPDAPILAALQERPPRFTPVPWPPELAALRRRLARSAGSGGFRPLPPVAPDVPGLLVVAWWRSPGGPADPGRRPPPPPAPVPGGYLIVRFDAAALRTSILPELTRRHFGSTSGLHETVAVVENAGPHQPPAAVFVSDPSIPASAFRTGDLMLPLFAVRHFAGDHRGGGGAGGGGGGAMDPHPARPMPAGGMADADAPPEPPHGPPAGWTLVVRRRGGSLEEAVAIFRRHNLALAAALVALAAVTTSLMTLATQRAQRLARQQMEFVAAITHELNTPLTAIRSAGQNLADGVVAEPAQVRRYGELILGEGRRLSRLVSQVLDFAGIESGRQTYSMQATAVDELVAGALEDCRPLLAERRARVESDLALPLPPVFVDPAALRRALRNLVENAAKYGGPDPWIGIQARQASGQVQITVADHGAGIRREDLPHLFEPFFRGRQAGAEARAGSGLGLSVVRHIMQAHRGRVTCATGGAHPGSAFTLHLPAAAETAT